MVTLTELLERANSWLKERNRVPLNSDETVYLLAKVAGLLGRDRKDKTYDANSIMELERDIVISFAINFVRVRNLWTLPKSIPWRGGTIVPSTIL